jgi:hypothetical protein
MFPANHPAEDTNALISHVAQHAFSPFARQKEGKLFETKPPDPREPPLPNIIPIYDSVVCTVWLT